MGQEESTGSLAFEQFKHRFIILSHPLYAENESIKLLHEKLNNKKFVLTILTNNDQAERNKLQELLCRKLATPSNNITPLHHYIFQQKNSYCAKISKCYLLISMEQSQTLRHFILQQKCKNSAKAPLSASQLISCIQQIANAINWLKYQNQVHGNITMNSIFVKQINTENSENNLKFYLGDPWICPLIGTTQYPSVQKLMKMNNQIEDQDPYLSDLFSLGMVILEYLFENLKGIYKSNYNIDMKRLKDYISAVEDQQLNRILTILLLGSQEEKKDFLISLSRKKFTNQKTRRPPTQQKQTIRQTESIVPVNANYQLFHRYSKPQQPHPIQNNQRILYRIQSMPPKVFQQPYRVSPQIISQQPYAYNQILSNNINKSPPKRDNSIQTRPIISIGGGKNMSVDNKKVNFVKNKNTNMQMPNFNKKPSYQYTNSTIPIKPNQIDHKFDKYAYPQQNYIFENKTFYNEPKHLFSNMPAMQTIQPKNYSNNFNFQAYKTQIKTNNFSTLPTTFKPAQAQNNLTILPTTFKPAQTEINYTRPNTLISTPVYDSNFFLKEVQKVKNPMLYENSQKNQKASNYQIQLSENHKYITESIKNLESRIQNLRDQTTRSMNSNYDGMVLTSTNFYQQPKIQNSEQQYQKRQTKSIQQQFSVQQPQEQEKTTHQEQKNIFVQSYSVKTIDKEVKARAQNKQLNRQSEPTYQIASNAQSKKQSCQPKSEIVSNSSPVSGTVTNANIEEDQIQNPIARQTQIQQLNTLMIPQQSDEDSEPSKSKVQRQFIQQIYQNGGHYRGYVRNGKRDGQGTFFYKDGGYYQGNWKKNMMNGYGKLYYETGKLAYQGYWHEDEFHGRGKVYNDSPIPLKDSFDYTDFENIELYWELYDGDLVHDIKQGFGKIILSNGQVFQGQFKDDKVHGRGIFKRLDGMVIKGLWNKCKLVKQL